MNRSPIKLCACLVVVMIACADGVAPDEGPPGVPPPPPPGAQLPDKPTPPTPPPPEGMPPEDPEPGMPPEDPGPDSPPEDPGPDSPPMEGDPRGCGGVDYLGKCEGDVAVWCEEDELLAYDCSLDGQSCRYIDDQIGYFCVEVGNGGEPAPELPPEGMPPEDPEPAPELPPEGMPPEGGDPPPDDPCPGVDAFGRCEGSVAVWCDDNEEILRFDCTLIGWVCMDLGLLGHRCVPPDNGGGQQQPGG